ncbi:flavoprotein [uncultured Akkermansia sp.]|uniref:flavoprotein n=1 Tax=uncultured Akkermansia sp. TaxID=512294 RepID=UPI002618D060|nr:flavoprotein [uncultured Akkermansia sp.]
MACIVLGVTGSIAAYKAADIASALVKHGHEVHCVCTAKALEFVPPHPAPDFPPPGLLLL